MSHLLLSFQSWDKRLHLSQGELGAQLSFPTHQSLLSASTLSWCTTTFLAMSSDYSGFLFEFLTAASKK